MASMDSYPRAAMERAMKVQDVMLQAMAKKITWWQAAEILGISNRTMRRWKLRCEHDGLRVRWTDAKAGQAGKRVTAGETERIDAILAKDRSPSQQKKSETSRMLAMGSNPRSSRTQWAWRIRLPQM